MIVPACVIDRMRLLLTDRTSDDLVFTAPRGGPLRAKDSGRRLFNHAAEPIGIPDLVAHDLRDTAASLAILRERP